MMTLEELHAHYKAVRARLDNPVRKEPAVRLIYPEPEPAPFFIAAEGTIEIKRDAAMLRLFRAMPKPECFQAGVCALQILRRLEHPSREDRREVLGR